MPVPYGSGLKQFAFSEDQLTDVESSFSLVLANARLESGASTATHAELPDNFNQSGVYLWSMEIDQVSYRVYVGKTNSLKRRYADYLKEFQPHSPNDFKIRILQRAVLEREPTAVFKLYFRATAIEKCTQLENEMVRLYKPLLNRRAAISPSVRQALCSAFESYYRAGFEELLSR